MGLAAALRIGQMPNKYVHTAAGAIAGAAAGYLASSSEDHLGKLSSCLGGVAGGLLTCRIPDFIDPPGSHKHRKIGHSILGNGIVLAFGYSKLALWNKQIQENAMQADEEENPLLACGWRFLGGMMHGLPTGLASHLLLDIDTPKGLPLVL